MPELTITLRVNPATGKKDIVVKLSSDADALPHEHEQMHRALVEKLLGRGVLDPDEAGVVIVQREDAEQVVGGTRESANSQAPEQQLGLSEDA